MFSDDLTAEDLKRLLRVRIQSGELLPGEAFPDEEAFARRYGLPLEAARQAIHRLLEQRYLVRLPGRGIVVRKPERNKVAFGILDESQNASFTTLGETFGLEISSRVLGKGILQNQRFFADRLGLDAREPLFALHRIRYGNREPLALEYSYVPAELFPGIQEVPFERASLYDFMAQKGHQPCRFRESMTMTTVGSRIAGYLKIREEPIASRIEILGFDQQGRTVEYTECYSPPDRLEVRFVT